MTSPSRIRPEPTPLDIRPTRGVTTQDGDRATVVRAETVILNTYQDMGSVRDALAGSGPGGFPIPGEALHIWTTANMTSLGIILRAVDVFGPMHFLACTYSISQRAIGALRQLVEREKLQSVAVLVSDTVLFRDPARVREMRADVAKYDGRIRYGITNVHAKDTLLSCDPPGKDPVRITMTGSGNMTDANAKFERYILFGSPKTFDHYAGQILPKIEARPLHGDGGGEGGDGDSSAAEDDAA